MIKTTCLSEQDEVRHIRIDGKDFYYIYLNGEEKTDLENGYNYFEYDYNEIICPEGTLDADDIYENPEKYIDYTYEEPAELTVEEQLNDIQLAQVEMYEMLLEMMGDE